MATLTALTASVTPQEAGLHVKFENLAGETVCEVSLASGSTLEDLEGRLKAHLGIRTAVYAGTAYDDAIRIFAHPSHEPLNKGERADAHAQLTFSIDVFVSARKFLAAMAVEAFLPRSPAFDVKWTLREAEYVTWAEVEPFLGSLDLSDLARAKFLRVFQSLTVQAEEWNGFHLGQLQCFDPALRELKHALCEHWLRLAREAATTRVARQPSCLFLLLKNERRNIIGQTCIGADAEFPDNFDPNLQNSSRLNDWSPTHALRPLMLVVASLDWGPQLSPTPATVWPFIKDAERLGSPAPSAWEVVRMAHVQLRLACDLGPVAVERNLDTTLFRFVAGCLGWKLCVLRFDRKLSRFVPDVENVEYVPETMALEEHLDRAVEEAKKDAEAQGVMMLVLDLPETHGLDNHCGSLQQKHRATLPVRFVLCECSPDDLRDPNPEP